MRERLQEAWIPNLLGLWEEIDTLRSEVHLLSKILTPIIPLIIPRIPQPLYIPPSLIFYLFVDKDEPLTTEAKRKWDPIKHSDSLDEFERYIKGKPWIPLSNFMLTRVSVNNAHWEPPLVDHHNLLALILIYLLMPQIEERIDPVPRSYHICLHSYVIAFFLSMY